MGATNTYLQGRTFYVLLSDDNWTTTYTLECLTKQSLSRSRAVNKIDNQCEVSKAYGNVDRNMPLEAVNNLTPDAVSGGVGTASYKKMSAWFEANTQIRVKRKTPSDGSQLYMESACKVSKLDDVVDVASVMTYSLELELEGTFDETA
jgi:hypothetical protein